MISTIQAPRCTVASLELSPHKVSVLVSVAQVIVESMTGNPAFPNPVLTLAEVTAATTLQAKTTVSGLVPRSTVRFRYRAVTKAGESDSSAPLGLGNPLLLIVGTAACEAITRQRRVGQMPPSRPIHHGAPCTGAVRHTGSAENGLSGGAAGWAWMLPPPPLRGGWGPAHRCVPSR